MKEWHLIVIEKNTIHYDKVFFDVNECRKAEKAKKEELAEQLASNKELRVLREYY